MAPRKLFGATGRARAITATKQHGVLINLPPDGIISYAYLFKQLKFQTPFTKMTDQLYFKKVGKVPAFEAKN